MAYLGSWKIDDLVTFPANTHSASTGAATDADSVPAYRVYEDETGTAILTGSMAKLDDANTTGFYSEQITLSAANGFEKGKCYTIYISAAVSSTSGTMNHTFQIEAEVDANTVSAANVSANVAQWNGTNVATPDTAGYPKTTIKSGTGTGEISVSSGVTQADVAKFGGTAGTFSGGRPEVNMSHIAGDATAGTNAKAFHNGAFITGSVSDASPLITDFTAAAGLSSTDDFYNGCTLVFTSGTLKGIARRVIDYTGLSRSFDFTGQEWPVAPVDNDTFIIIGRIEA